MNNLFTQNDQVLNDSPLAARMRPRNLSEYIGQSHIVFEGKLLNRALAADRLSSLILYGPPGVGKTTLALCICQQTQSHFERINAVSSNVEDMRRVIAGAQHRRATSGKKTVFFIDEIHRFNKAQQDVLMPDIEEGNIILVGATVFNPFFALVSPLLSRSLVFELKPLSVDEMKQVLNRAIADQERGLGQLPVKISDESLVFLASMCDGDARKALNALEIAVVTTPKNSEGVIELNLEVVQESIQKKALNYDANGDNHYDTISAFIKSMRGSDPDAAVYWLAKMIYAGEDPRFIARRIVICASEDVGNADPNALVVAQAAMQATQDIGMPEARIILSQAVIYVACAPKSNASYVAIEKAMEDVRTKTIAAIPEHLKDGHYKGAKTLGHGVGYQYAHDFPGHFVKQQYKPHDAIYYEPTGLGYEAKIKERLEKLKKL